MIKIFAFFEACYAFATWLYPKVVAVASWVFRQIKKAIQAVLAWLGPVEDAIVGQLNLEEAKRALIKALSTGTIAHVGIAEWVTSTGILESIVLPSVVGLIVFAADLGRRRSHGEPTPTHTA